MSLVNTCKGVVFKLLLLTSLAGSLLMQVGYVKANEKKEDKWNVLVVYSSENGEITEHQRILNMLIGHFTREMTFKLPSQVKQTDLDAATHLIYYGYMEEMLPAAFLELLDSYTGITVALGYNVEQLGNKFTFIEPVSTEQINHIALAENKEKQVTFVSNLVLNVKISEDTEVIVVGGYANKTYPMFVKNGDYYYFASNDLRPPTSIFVAEAFHHVFEEDHAEIHPAYLRLEDIHPLVEPDKLKQIADILREKKIPYMLAVIPVYTNPETGKQYHFSDSPKLLNVLKYMQDNGGSIVLHGYTHQFRMSETGEGFEFWDVEHNMPIYHGHDELVVIKTREDFDTQAMYEAYLSGQKAFERDYIQTKLTRGIQELANFGLYPLAFEAPHYTMSQHGYEVTAEHFSTYVGQVQISDEDWEIMTTAPYITNPSFLKGMTLLPETLGYVLPKDPYAVDKMLQKAEDYQIVRDGMIAGFYHPYLGVERFLELINELEKIPNISWIDLKQMNNTVRAENIEISSLQGELKAEVNHGQLFLLSSDFLFYHVRTIVEKIVWGIAVIGALAVLLFIANIVVLSVRNKRIGRDYFG